MNKRSHLVAYGMTVTLTLTSCVLFAAARLLSVTERAAATLRCAERSSPHGRAVSVCRA
jgi:hypothetical protein